MSKEQIIKKIRKELREWNKLATALEKNKDTLTDYGKGMVFTIIEIVKSLRKKLSKIER